MRTLGIITARGGSKGIPKKNLRSLGGRPLLAYTAESARSSGVFDRVILSTDSEEIAAIGRKLGIEVPFIRPPELAQDETPMLSVLKHAVKRLEADGWRPEAIVLLQPTSPMRKAKHIQDALNMLVDKEADSVVSVVEIPHIFNPQKALRSENGFLHFWYEHGKEITRRQQVDVAYARDGTIYAFWRETLMKKNSIYGERCLPLLLGLDETLNLDTMSDWQRAQKIFERSKKENE